MESTNNKQKPQDMIRYPLASAGRRIGSKIVDILIVGVIVFLLGLAIFATQEGFDWHQLQPADPWRYAVFVIVMFIVFFGLLFILPRFTKWTLAMKLFKLQYFNILPLSNLSFNLFKHELLIWEIMVFISFVLGITLTFLTPTKAISMLYGVAFYNQPIGIDFDMPSYYAGIAFASLYYASFAILIFILIAVCIKSKRPAIHDKFSNLYVIHMSPLSTLDKQGNTKKKKQTRVNYGIPGEINSGSFEEIDNLE